MSEAIIDEILECKFSQALTYLEHNGITDHGRGIFVVEKDRVLTDNELKYLQFLMDEYDYGFERI
jgi:hypothetical protein